MSTDGIEATRQYRKEEPAERRLPLIALAANAAEDLKQGCLEAGMDDFLTKPVDPDNLSAIIRRCVPQAN
jgi:CheY-like chemotaxis protein